MLPFINREAVREGACGLNNFSIAHYRSPLKNFQGDSFGFWGLSYTQIMNFEPSYIIEYLDRSTSQSDAR